MILNLELNINFIFSIPGIPPPLDTPGKPKMSKNPSVEKGLSGGGANALGLGIPPQLAISGVCVCGVCGGGHWCAHLYANTHIHIHTH